MHIETISRGNKKYALLPLTELNKLLKHSQMLADIRAYDAAHERLRLGEDEIIPFSIIDRRLNGEMPLKIWREYRGHTQENLAALSGVSRPMIAAIESGYKQGSISTLNKLAKALDVAIEQLMPPGSSS